MSSCRWGISGLGGVSLQLKHRVVCQVSCLALLHARQQPQPQWLRSAPHLQRGVIAAGSVNHTLAVLHAVGAAAAARGIRVPARIFVPRSAPSGRAERLRQLGGQVDVAGADEAEAEGEARAAAQCEGAAFIDALSDPQVSGGLGSIAIELLMQLPRGRLDAGEGRAGCQDVRGCCGMQEEVGELCVAAAHADEPASLQQDARQHALLPIPCLRSLCAGGAQRWPAGGHCCGAQGGRPRNPSGWSVPNGEGPIMLREQGSRACWAALCWGVGSKIWLPAFLIPGCAGAVPPAACGAAAWHAVGADRGAGAAGRRSWAGGRGCGGD